MSEKHKGMFCQDLMEHITTTLFSDANVQKSFDAMDHNALIKAVYFQQLVLIKAFQQIFEVLGMYGPPEQDNGGEE